MANSFRQIIEAPSQLLQDPFNLLTWLSSFWRKLGQVEEWHEVGSSGEPVFAGTWVNFGGSNDTAAFYKDPWGRVHIKGSIKSGTIGTNCFTLPSGYHPPGDLYFAAYSNGAFGGIRINTSGVVRPITGSTTEVSINCSFRVED